MRAFQAVFALGSQLRSPAMRRQPHSIPQPVRKGLFGGGGAHRPIKV
jgi:hypothetical protein